MKDLNHHWKGVEQDFDPEGYEGFIYLITCISTGRKYIGRKYFFNKNRVKQVGKKNRKLVIKGADWNFYKSSSKDVKEDIKVLGIDNFSFEILSLHKTRGQTNYAEVKEQFKRDVLYSIKEDGIREYYNANILSRYFLPKEVGTIEYDTKCNNISKSLKESYASGKIIHPMLGKQHPSKGKQLPQCGHNKGKGRVCYTNGVTIVKLMPEDEVPKGFYKGVPKKEQGVLRQYAIDRYEANPKLCKNCNSPIPYNRRRTFISCSEVCQEVRRLGKRQHQAGKGNPYTICVWITPFGEFHSLGEATMVITDISMTTIYNRCKKGKNGWDIKKFE